jgi:hypothetical protein
MRGSREGESQGSKDGGQARRAVDGSEHAGVHKSCTYLGANCDRDRDVTQSSRALAPSTLKGVVEVPRSEFELSISM